jgi:hypothetical protein
MFIDDIKEAIEELKKVKKSLEPIESWAFTEEIKGAARLTVAMEQIEAVLAKWEAK